VKKPKTGRIPKHVRAAVSDRRPGRPKLYTPILGAKYCSLIASGMTVKAASTIAAMPSITQVLEWQGLYPEFQAAYARAREARAEFWAAEALEVAQRIPEHVVDPKTGRVVIDSGMVQKARLVTDTLKWLLVKLHPKQYGDTQQLRHAGHDGGPIVTPRNAQLENLSDEQLDKLIALADAGAEAGEAEGLGAVSDTVGDAGEAGPSDPSRAEPT
jgi:hypothetical protein